MCVLSGYVYPDNFPGLPINPGHYSLGPEWEKGDPWKLNGFVDPGDSEGQDEV